MSDDYENCRFITETQLLLITEKKALKNDIVSAHKKTCHCQVSTYVNLHSCKHTEGLLTHVCAYLWRCAASISLCAL